MGIVVKVKYVAHVPYSVILLMYGKRRGGMTTTKLELRTLQFQNQPLPTERKG